MKQYFIFLINILCLIGLYSCSDGPSKSEQERIIRETYPVRTHLKNGENMTSTSYDLQRFYCKGPNNADGLMFYVIWETAKKDGYLEAIKEKVRNSDESLYAKSYIEYFNQYYSDYYDDGTPEVDLMQKDYLNIGHYENVPSKIEILEYMIGHIKACAPTPEIIAMEYIKDKSLGNYWLVHLTEGEYKKIRFFKKDNGAWEYDVFK